MADALTDHIFHNLHGLLGWRARPENINIVCLISNLKNTENHVSRHDRIHFNQQVAYPVFPVTDGFGCYNKAFKNPYFKLQHLLAYGHFSDLAYKFGELTKNILKLAKPVRFALQLSFQFCKISHAVYGTNLPVKSSYGFTKVCVYESGHEKRHQKRNRNKDKENSKKFMQERTAKPDHLLFYGQHTHYLANFRGRMTAKAFSLSLKRENIFQVINCPSKTAGKSLLYRLIRTFAVVFGFNCLARLDYYRVPLWKKLLMFFDYLRHLLQVFAILHGLGN
ncbi:MAG TPA: hypothetical protein HPP95_04800 [Deltaproteobacteria bacterium]|nr:hypothetical protein [Deltaproteobacteria bacterium]